MERSIFVIGVILLGGLLAGCDAVDEAAPPQVVGVYEDQEVRITVTRAEVVIENLGQEALYYAVYPSEDLPFIEWAPCEKPEDCAGQVIAPGEAWGAVLDELVEDGGKGLAFFWWQLEEYELNGRYRVVNFNNWLALLGDG